MAFNPNIHHRRSIRLRGYDYAKSGVYFVTICAQHRECLFGDVVNETMHLNAAGQMIEHWYFELENKFPDIRCMDFVCMPNHVHFIVENVGANLCVRPENSTKPVGADLCVCPNGSGEHANYGEHMQKQGEHKKKQGEHMQIQGEHMQKQGEHKKIQGEHKKIQGEHIGSPLRAVVQWFKTMTTNAYMQGVKQHHWRAFDKKLWQRNYYEHIVRSDESLQSIQQYITNNPALWQQDTLYPNTQEMTA